MIAASVCVDSWPSNDATSLARAGVGLNTDPTTGDGYNLLFSAPGQVQFLDDKVGWGNAYPFNWSVGTWYSFKLENVNGTLLGKVWQDGTPQPSGWMFTQSGWTDRTSGVPSVNGGSGKATVSFNNITVSSAAATDIVATNAPTTALTPAPSSTPSTTPVTAPRGNSASYDPATRTVQFTLTAPTLTSAGVFDTQGRLVRTLWSMVLLAAGPHSAQWDGNNDSGQPAPAGGSYTVQIILNGASYQNVGAIGNSDPTPNVAGHTPVNIESVAIDASGAVYTADGWDEPGADFAKWDANGVPVYNANFAIRNGQPNGAPDRVTTDSTYMYLTVFAWDGQQQVQRFLLSDGSPAPFTGSGSSDGHINIYNQVNIPANTPAADAALMQHPLQGIAVDGSSIWVTDALGSRVLQYNKQTGALVGQFAVTLPQAIAINSSGQLWVAHQHGVISVYSPSGTVIGQAVSGLSDVGSLTFGSDGRLYVADRGVDQVKIYAVSGTHAQLVQTFGQKAQPGDSDPSHFFNLQSVAVDSSGNLVTADLDPSSGASLAKWSPSGTLLWRQFGNEMGANGNYAPGNPNLFYTTSFHAYSLTDPSTGVWQYLGDTAPGGTLYTSNPHGSPRVITLNGSNYFFSPTGDGVQVYRIDGGAFHLVAVVGGHDPAPDGTNKTEALGQWTWSDVNGTGQPAAGELHWYKSPGQSNYSTNGMEIDAVGNIWFADSSTGGVWELPLTGLDTRGNPSYDWSQARMVISPSQFPAGFQPSMVQHADDGSIYVMGYNSQLPISNTPFWMGGTILLKYDASRTLLWTVQLPEVSTGMDVIPGGAGGVIVGGGTTSRLYQYDADGLLIGTVAPGAAMNGTSGWFDQQDAVTVNRNPQDGVVDIFTEDDYGLRVGWYRVNDQAIQTLSVNISAPSAVAAAPANLGASTGAAGQVVLTWSASPGASGYQLERSPDRQSGWTTIETMSGTTLDAPASLLTTDADLTPGTTYFYRVVALNAQGASTPTAVVSATTSSTSTPTLAVDAFTAPTLSSAWKTTGGTWTTANGVLSQTSASFADPKKAILVDQTYPLSVTITAKVRVDSWSADNTLARAGVGLGTNTSTGQGFNLVFTGTNTVQFLNDGVQWGNKYAFNWSVGTWYWFKLVDNNGTLEGKIWTDGMPEPAAWMFVESDWTDRAGAPSLNGGSADATVSFADVAVTSSSGA